MIAAIWTLFALMLVLWTAGVWAAAQLAEWTARAVASGAVLQLEQAEAALGSAPGWIREWIGPVLVDALLPGMQWAGAAAAWLPPFLWAAWFIVAFLMVIGAVTGHLLIRRLRTRPEARWNPTLPARPPAG